MDCPACRADNDPAAAACARCGWPLTATPSDFIITVDLKPGSLFHGRYEILGFLGKGGMGMVYKARDRSLDEVVAIKILRPEFAQDPAMAERFKTEIRLARKVRHRNVCAIHDYGEEQGLLFISMEWLEGVDLKHVLDRRGGLPPEEAYDLAIQVAEGLQAVHDAGIIHRDLKTSNIMQDALGTARLMDFGIAKRFGETTLTATGAIVGTPEYMSPEQAQGLKVDFRSDVYALGVVIYEIFTGHVPFKGETPISTILKQLHDPPPIETREAPGLPPDLRPVLRRCLAKDAAQRFPTARDVAEALRRALSAGQQRPAPAPAPTLKWRHAPVPHAAGRRAPVGAPVARPIAPAQARPALGRGPRRWLLALPVVVLAAGAVALGERWLGKRGEPVTSPEPVPSVANAPPGTASSPLPAVQSAPSTEPASPASAPSTPPPTTRPSEPAATPSVASRPSGSPPAAREAPPRAAVPGTPARQEPVPSGTGWLLVVVKPWGEVSVDGKVVGTTPLDRFSLATGVHVLSVRHPAFQRLSRQVTIRPDETERVVLDLSKEGAPAR